MLFSTRFDGPHVPRARRAAEPNEIGLGRGTDGSVSWFGSLEVAKRRYAELGLDLRWRTNPGATQAAIEACERSIGVALPDDLRAFLLESDGGVLERHRPDEIVPEQGLYLFFLSSAEIAARTLAEREFARVDLGVLDVGRYVWIVDYQDANYIVYDPDRSGGTIVDGFHEETAYWSSYPPLAASFTDFVARISASMLRGERIVYWLSDATTP
jgi:hypothetical protein